MHCGNRDRRCGYWRGCQRHGNPLETATSVIDTLTIFWSGVERTREIGLRKAVGAQKVDIMIQFLIETSLLSMSGGIIGVALGWGIAQLVGQIASFGVCRSPLRLA